MQLDNFQEEARLNTDQRVLLVAPPGSGKTTVLLAKIAYLVNERGVDPTRMLVLTFSRSASDNMKERFLKQRPSGSPFFGTIHSFAYREISRRKGAIQLISPGQAMHALHPVRRQFLLSPEEVSRTVSGISKERATGQLDASIPKEFRIKVRSVYEDYKKKHLLLDFDDLEEEFLKMLEERPYREKLQAGIDWVMVDEFQDLNRIQLNILKRLAEKSRLFCVGDEDQCIYAFRGSDTRAMVDFGEEFQGGRILYLQYNYRCSATIVRHANQVIGCNLERYPKKIINFRQDETPVQGLLFENERASWEYVAQKLHSLTPSATCALILRTNGEMEELAHFLVKRGIRFSFLDQPFNRYNRMIFKNLIPYLIYAQKPNQAIFLELLKTRKDKLPGDILSQLRLLEVWEPQDLLNQDKFSLNVEIRESLTQLFRDLKKLRAMKPGEGIRYILYVMGYHQWLEQVARKTGAPLIELVEEVEGFAREAAAFPTIRDFLRYLRAWDEIIEKSRPQERLLLSTMHGVKGMEFDEVIILNAYEGAIPHEKSLNDMEAERRLFYVAVTRARHNLQVICPKTWKGTRVTPSPFLAELGIETEDGSQQIKLTVKGRRCWFSGYSRMWPPNRMRDRVKR